MDEIKPGDRVRVKNRLDWPVPPGYRLSNMQGTVIKIWEETGPAAYQEYIAVKFDESRGDVDISHPYNFRKEMLDRLQTP